MEKSNRLGITLKKLREKSGKTRKEAAEIFGVSRSYLSKVENSQERPSRDFLDKTHFIYNLSLDEFSQLLEFAGYPKNLGDLTRKEALSGMNAKKEVTGPESAGIQVEVPEGMDVLYCDSVFITSSPYGVIISFAQSGAPLQPNKHKVVARIGTSKIHGLALVNTLRENLEKSERSIINSKKVES